jgi:hypothetical protein
MDIIKPVQRDSDLEAAARVVRAAFAAVAAEFDLTPENCPTHASFVTAEQLAAMGEKGAELRSASWKKSWNEGYNRYLSLTGIVRSRINNPQPSP